MKELLGYNVHKHFRIMSVIQSFANVIFDSSFEIFGMRKGGFLQSVGKFRERRIIVICSDDRGNAGSWIRRIRNPAVDMNS